MSSNLPSISVITTSTNSFGRGYLAYLASIKSWEPHVDQILVVDGGTTDNSNEMLNDWVPSPKISFLQNDQTYWPEGQLWHAGQWTHSTNQGIQKAATDWAIIICSDYVLNEDSAQLIRRELASLKNEPAALFRRYKLDNTGKRYLTSLRGVALNLRHLRTQAARVGFGVVDNTNQPSDHPIVFKKKTSFVDPNNSAVKTLFGGDWLPITSELDFETSVYGHYFMTSDQLLSKVCNYSWVYQVRYAGRAPINPKSFHREFQLQNQNRIRYKKIELKKPHPKEILELIDAFYNENMLGHDGGQIANTPKLTRATIRAQRAANNLLFKRRDFPDLSKTQEWHAINSPEALALDLRRHYAQQDLYLPNYMHIDHTLDTDKVSKTKGVRIEL